MYNRFKVGQKVVALTNPKTERSQPRVKGKVYTVIHIRYCTDCGVQQINIGGNLGDGLSSILSCSCGNQTDNNGLAWTDSIHFAPVEDIEEETEALESLLGSMGIDISEKVLVNE